MQNKLTVFYDHILNAAKQRGVTTAQIAADITACGISGVEMDYYMLKESGDALAEELTRLGLPINNCYCFFDWANHPEDQSYIQVLDDLKRLDIMNLLVVPGFVSRDIVATGNQDIITTALARAREAMLPNMIHLLDYASELGINVAMEDFDDISAPFATKEQVKWFLDRLPALGCAFDTGNFLYSEQDVMQAYELLSDRITYVHCKDRSLAPVEGENGQTTVNGRQIFSSAVGNGVIPMADILKLLEEKGYVGTIAIEHFGSTDQLSDMKTSASFLKYFT